MLDNLTNRFSKVFKNIRGQAKLTEDNIKEALREVRLALLEADVALPVVKEFVNNVKEKASAGSCRQPDARPSLYRRRQPSPDRIDGQGKFLFRLGGCAACCRFNGRSARCG